MSVVLPAQVVEKFWGAIEKTNFCWNWTGIFKTGSPIVIAPAPLPKTIYQARRISIELIRDEQLTKSDRVLPLVCRNKLCVNPDHLVYGDEGRFWSKVQKMNEHDGGCWIWLGYQTDRMYGQFYYYENGKQITVQATAYSWFLYAGRPVPNGLLVCHKCDHPYCVNPHHLFLGTNQDNMQDMIDKERQCKGEDCHSSKLTKELVQEIRLLSARGLSNRQLGKQFGVSHTNIGCILRGEIWKSVI